MINVLMYMIEDFNGEVTNADKLTGVRGHLFHCHDCILADL